MMRRDEKVIWQHASPPPGRHFLQPLSVAIVCAVFIGLILITGLMDLQRLDKTLVSFMENQGLSIVGVVQKLTQENLNSLRQTQQTTVERGSVPVTAFSPKQFLLAELRNFAVEVDKQWKADRLSEDYLRKFAIEKKLWLIAVLNEQGDLVFQNRPFPSDVARGDVPVMDGGRNIRIELLRQLVSRKIPFVAAQRKDRSGTVIIALDREGQRYWATKVSIEKVIEELGDSQGQNLMYIVVMDQQEMVFGSVGKLPDKWDKRDASMSGVFSGSRKVVSRKISHHGKSLLDIASPLYLDDQVMGVVRLGLDREGMDKIIVENRRNIFVFMTIVVLITLLSMWLLYRNQNRHLAGIVEMERRLEKAERLSAIGQLAAGVAHEIRNPLNAISMASQRLKREFIPADEGKNREFHALAGVIRDEIRRLNGIIEEFLTFSKSRRLEFHEYPVTEVLQKIVNLIREEATSKGITLETRFNDNTATIPMDVDKLQQAFLNFIKNAMESISGSGSIVISLEQSRKDRINVKISDTGCGMTPEEVERIFNPEYTTKEKGLGLGLPLAHEIVRGHGGEIRVLSRLGSGTTFEIILPSDRMNDREAKG
ncbi:MAG: ATP-binding protein [Deltaproteobacteria bacterium]|nr:ATP-binding protein [Deltaproteobacteria bacterium]